MNLESEDVAEPDMSGMKDVFGDIKKNMPIHERRSSHSPIGNLIHVED